ncbi:tautomerase family protein [Stenotrophomonas rhizophila]|uniref:tautomerase family protein n=1 Tax=Stenotrophomonas rhizophila TaxID=216778 RepID=UPI0011A391CC|nr:tautomerase family protein [Stenotrophomonas rhizophila]
MPLARIDLRKGKPADYRRRVGQVVCDGLHAAVGIRREDVFINLVEVKRENGSFGNGVAQYAA